jgi:hypothetical protein
MRCCSPAKIRDHEQRAFGKREFTLSPDPCGSGGLIRGRYDAAGYAVLTAALEGLCTPWSDGITADLGQDKDDRTPAQRRYNAIVEVSRRSLHHPTISSGDGGKAQIRVTIPLACLTERVSLGLLDDGSEISPTLARMLASDAAIIPVVLNAHGQPVDVGPTDQANGGCSAGTTTATSKPANGTPSTTGAGSGSDHRPE